VQLPYLITVAEGKPFRIVPIVTNSIDPHDHKVLASALVKMSRKRKALLLVSSDLSHFPSADIAQKVDSAILKAMETLDYEKLQAQNSRTMKEGHAGLACTMCGLSAALTMMRSLDGIGIDSGKIVSYTHSGMAGAGRDRVVGYGAVIFTGEKRVRPPSKEADMTLEFTQDSRKELIRLAREAVKASVSGEWVSYEPSDNPELQVKAGCFVTLKNKGRLRGCIGRFTGDKPIWDIVRQMAVASATKDARFKNDPIVPDEVPDLSIEVSVLSPPRETRKPLEEVKLGRDGIIVRDGGKSGTFLPQVATETGWNLQEFLGHCARDKAGIGWDGWKSPTATVYTFTATIIDEE
jgi:AmmeMemoRadiSam system protein A